MKEKQLIINIAFAVTLILAAISFVQAAVQMTQLLLDHNVGSVFPYAAAVSADYVVYVGPLLTIAVGLALISFVSAALGTYIFKNEVAKLIFIIVQAAMTAALLVFVCICKLNMEFSEDGKTVNYLDLNYANSMQTVFAQLFILAAILTFLTVYKFLLQNKQKETDINNQ